MAGERIKVARAAREAVQGRITAWLATQSGTQQQICKRLGVSYSQLHALVNEGAERCSLEYLLDVWERCGGAYTLELMHDSFGPKTGATK
jgi:predicted XRE-type DNA-binding protein